MKTLEKLRACGSSPHTHIACAIVREGIFFNKGCICFGTFFVKKKKKISRHPCVHDIVGFPGSAALEFTWVYI